MGDILQAGERVLLCQNPEKSYMIRLTPGAVFSSHTGRFPHDDMIGKQPGQWVRSHLGRPMLVLRPTTTELMMKVRRQTNINYPKDVAQILLRCGIIPGMRVIEVGTGSGSMTIALAAAVGPTGKVYSFDVRADHQDQAKRNIKEAQLLDRVELRRHEPGQPFGVEEADAITLDVPTPWEEIDSIRKAVKLGGRLASLNPTFNQIEQFATALDGNGFYFVEAEEIIWRKILARAGRTRPEQRMIGHTEFLLYAIRADAPPVFVPPVVAPLVLEKGIFEIQDTVEEPGNETDEDDTSEDVSEPVDQEEPQ